MASHNSESRAESDRQRLGSVHTTRCQHVGPAVTRWRVGMPALRWEPCPVPIWAVVVQYGQFPCTEHQSSPRYQIVMIGAPLTLDSAELPALPTLPQTLRAPWSTASVWQQLPNAKHRIRVCNSLDTLRGSSSWSWVPPGTHVPPGQRSGAEPTRTREESSPPPNPTRGCLAGVRTFLYIPSCIFLPDVGYAVWQPCTRGLGATRRSAVFSGFSGGRVSELDSDSTLIY